MVPRILLKHTNPHIYLIKQLKRMGFKQDLLINIYRSVTLSQYLYSAPMLTSASNKAKKEMDKQQQRSTRAWRDYKIPHISDFIDQQCRQNVERMLKDPDHPLTLKTTKKGHQEVHILCQRHSITTVIEIVSSKSIFEQQRRLRTRQIHEANKKRGSNDRKRDICQRFYT